MQSLLILGRQPLLGLAELESLYGNDKVELVAEDAAIVDVDPCLLAFDRLGGSIKFCKLLTSLPYSNWQKIEDFLISVSPSKSETMPEGKMLLGISAYGLKVSPKQIMASGLKLKKAIQQTGRSVRFIPNKEAALNSAQVSHNRLLSDNGWELVIVKSGDQTIIGQSVKVQDIDSYSARDQARPKRDSKVGMLPPKLAQIIVNLATGKLAEDQLESICEIPADQTIPPPDLEQTILDPFCGSGVVIQESLLMGYHGLASDIDPRMVKYCEENIDWLEHKYKFIVGRSSFKVADATIADYTECNFIASELFLGRPLSVLPSSGELDKIIADCDVIIRKTLLNLARQTSPDLRLCLAVPAWQTSPNIYRQLPLVDQIEDLGYNKPSFKGLGGDNLIYSRPNQIVARQLLVLTRK